MSRLLFRNVGRHKKCWTLDVDLERDEIAEALILASIRKSGALMSSDIDFELDLEQKVGCVNAGFRTVGQIVILPDDASGPGFQSESQSEGNSNTDTVNSNVISPLNENKEGGE